MLTNYRNKYNRGFIGLRNLSRKTGLKPELVGEMIIKEKRGEIARFVKEAGMTPDTDSTGLAIQATIAHQKRVEQKAKQENLSLSEAENKVLDRQEFLSYTGNVEDFDPSLLAVVASVADKGVQALNAKRVQQGKKPILSGPFWQSLKTKTKNVGLSAEGSDLNIKIRGGETPTDSQLAAGLGGAADEIERIKKREFIKKNAVWFALAGVAIIVLIYLAIKKK